MKRSAFFLAGILFLCLSITAGAQSKTGVDYFTGKWNVLLKGLPDGDTRMVFVLENTNDKLTGVVQDTTGNEISKLSAVDVKDASATLYFSAQGYDLILVLNKKDEDNVTGTFMDMFEAEGTRVNK